MNAMATHQVTCAGGWCPEWSVISTRKPVDAQKLAADHRRQLAEDGWTDREGRDYCPDHRPVGEGG